MMLEYLGCRAASAVLDAAVRRTYAEGRVLTSYQCGRASSAELTAAVAAHLGAC